MDTTGFSKGLSIKDVKVTDGFWKRQIDLVRDNVIPYQWEALNDRIEGAAKSYCMRNYRLSGEINEKRKRGEEIPVFPTDIFETLPEDENNPEDRFYGFVFQDSDFSKWIEAVSYSLNNYYDEELVKTADEAIDIVCKAACDDGYLDTFYNINNIKKRFTNLRDHHELYCFGHFTEGAVAYYIVTGKDKLLNAAKKFADLLCEFFGSEEGKCHGYPGHEIAEMALVRLYEVTGEEKYLNLCRFFIDERGKRPYYFDAERNIADDGTEKYHYHQAHRPVRQQDEATGHAVRAVYLYSAMADVAKLTQDEELFQACEKIWNNIVNKKMYITGGIGGTHIGEAFSINYDLPADTAYAETCAAIGMAFFAKRMLLIKPDAKYADVLERTLYNGILSGMAEDGKSFFYVNPLYSNPYEVTHDERKFHVKPTRQKWFGCACCPPNIARIVSSINTYAYTEKDNILFVNLYMGSEISRKINGVEVKYTVDADITESGKISVLIESKEDVEVETALRIPSWCEGKYTLKNVEYFTEKDGYIHITQKVCEKSSIEVEFDMPVRVVRTNAKVRENAGKLTIMRGPFVYCMEEEDNGRQLHNIEMSSNPEIKLEKLTEFANKTYGVVTSGRKLDDMHSQLYYNASEKPAYTDINIKWVPYFQWANRGCGEMSVFVREIL